MANAELLTILHESKLFKGLSEDELTMISAYGKQIAFERNDTIIKECQTDSSIFVILTGQVEVILPKRRNGQARERATRIILGKMFQGDFIGEYSIVDNEPASASVIGIEAGRLFEIKKQDFEKILNISDRLAKTIYRNMLLVMAKRIREINKELDICF